MKYFGQKFNFIIACKSYINFICVCYLKSKSGYSYAKLIILCYIDVACLLLLFNILAYNVSFLGAVRHSISSWQESHLESGCDHVLHCSLRINSLQLPYLTQPTVGSFIVAIYGMIDNSVSHSAAVFSSEHDGIHQCSSLILI